MSSRHDLPCRVAVIGASSLLGKELKQVLEDHSFPASEVRLLDDVAVGTLTEAGGEPTFIRGLHEDSLRGVRFAFFAGDAAGTKRHWPEAQSSGTTVIDLTGALADLPTAVPWIPALDPVLPPPRPAVGKLFASPTAAAIIACSIAAALAPFSVTRLAMVLFQPVSECGEAGIEELESQTVKLLSFQSISQEVFDSQVAFNLLAQYGEASRVRLGEVRAALTRDVARYLAGRTPAPALQVLQAPVFYSTAFTAFVEFAVERPLEELHASLARAGAQIRSDNQPLSNVSVAGENHIALARIEPDATVGKGYWLWGAADNVRLAAMNAVAIAEKLLAC